MNYLDCAQYDCCHNKAGCCCLNSEGCGNVATANPPASPETDSHCDDKGCRYLEGRCCCADHVSIDECSCGPECATRAPKENNG